MNDIKQAEYLQSLADKEKRIAYESDSLTNWKRVDQLEKEAKELRLKANAKAHAALMELFPYASGQPYTLGYIGNIEKWGDDRSWRIFGGRYQTNELHLLLADVQSPNFKRWKGE